MSVNESSLRNAWKNNVFARKKRLLAKRLDLPSKNARKKKSDKPLKSHALPKKNVWLRKSAQQMRSSDAKKPLQLRVKRSANALPKNNDWRHWPPKKMPDKPEHVRLNSRG